MPAAALMAAIESWLPIASAFHLFVEAGILAVRAQLIERIDAAPRRAGLKRERAA